MYSSDLILLQTKRKVITHCHGGYLIINSNYGDHCKMLGFDWSFSSKVVLNSFIAYTLLKRNKHIIHLVWLIPASQSNNPWRSSLASITALKTCWICLALGLIYCCTTVNFLAKLELVIGGKAKTQWKAAFKDTRTDPEQYNLTKFENVIMMIQFSHISRCVQSYADGFYFFRTLLNTA